MRAARLYAPARCETPRCMRPAEVLCKFPVSRRGRASRCNRHVCRGCSKDGLCAPHARAVAQQPSLMLTICAHCFTLSCVHGELPCARRGPTRSVTQAQWITLMSFGVL